MVGPPPPQLPRPVEQVREPHLTVRVPSLPTPPDSAQPGRRGRAGVRIQPVEASSLISFPAIHVKHMVWHSVVLDRRAVLPGHFVNSKIGEQRTAPFTFKPLSRGASPMAAFAQRAGSRSPPRSRSPQRSAAAPTDTPRLPAVGPMKLGAALDISLGLGVETKPGQLTWRSCRGCRTPRQPATIGSPGRNRSRSHSPELSCSPGGGGGAFSPELLPLPRQLRGRRSRSPRAKGDRSPSPVKGDRSPLPVRSRPGAGAPTLDNRTDLSFEEVWRRCLQEVGASRTGGPRSPRQPRSLRQPRPPPAGSLFLAGRTAGVPPEPLLPPPRSKRRPSAGRVRRGSVGLPGIGPVIPQATPRFLVGCLGQPG